MLHEEGCSILHSTAIRLARSYIPRQRAEGSVTLRLLALESRRNTVSGIEQTAPVSLRQPHLSWLKGNQVQESAQ